MANANEGSTQNPINVMGADSKMEFLLRTAILIFIIFMVQD